MTLARAALLVAAFAACAAPARADDAALAGDALLARVKAVYRALPRPPYVVYALRRTDRRNGLLDLENTYGVKIWCRYADRLALQRPMFGGEVRGELQGITVAFDAAVDPGPPTIDIFEKRLFMDGYARISPRRLPSGDAATPPPLVQIGSVRAGDVDYAVTRTAREGADLHLQLAVRANPLSNRLTDVWVDRTTLAMRRARMRDRLYFGPGRGSIGDTFDAHFAPGPNGLPVIDTIDGVTDDGVFETHYAFSALQFPDTLPEWYFQPETYGKHVREAPL